MKFHPSKPYQKYWARLESWRSKTTRSCSTDHKRSTCTFVVRNNKSSATLRAISTILAKSWFVYLDDRASAILETVGTKINWIVVCPLAKIVTFIYNTPRFERYQRVHVTLALKIRSLGEPFLKFAFFFTKRRYLLAYRQQILSQRLQTLTQFNNDGCRVATTSGDINRCSRKGHQSINTFQQFHGRSSNSGLGLGCTSQSTAECSARLFKRGRV